MDSTFETPIFEDSFDLLVATAFERFVEAAPCTSCVVRNRESLTLPVYGEVKVLAFRDATYGVMEFIYSEDRLPLEITVRGFSENDDSYRWIHPSYAREHRSVVGQDNPSLELISDVIVDEKWYETESIDDIIVKVESIMTGANYDHTVVLVLDLDEETIEALKSKAELAGITMDKYIEESLGKLLSKLDAKGSGSKS